MNDKKADLAGPGISTYEEVAKILPNDYRAGPAAHGADAGAV